MNYNGKVLFLFVEFYVELHYVIYHLIYVYRCQKTKLDIKMFRKLSVCKMALKRKRQIYHLWMYILFPILLSVVYFHTDSFASTQHSQNLVKKSLNITRNKFSLRQFDAKLLDTKCYSIMFLLIRIFRLSF